MKKLFKVFGAMMLSIMLVTAVGYSAPRPVLFNFIPDSLITTMPQDLENDVAADVLVIPVTRPMVNKVTGADAEALTLADGLPGQVLVVRLGTDGGGDGTLTPATATGWATIVFADAGDQAVLFYVDDTLGWIIIGLSGKAGPPAHT